MPNSSTSGASFLYRALVLILLLGIAGGVAYNYYQASTERAQCRQEGQRTHHEVRCLRKELSQ